MYRALLSEEPKKESADTNLKKLEESQDDENDLFTVYDETTSDDFFSINSLSTKKEQPPSVVTYTQQPCCQSLTARYDSMSLMCKSLILSAVVATAFTLTLAALCA